MHLCRTKQKQPQILYFSAGKTRAGTMSTAEAVLSEGIDAAADSGTRPGLN